MDFIFENSHLNIISINIFFFIFLFILIIKSILRISSFFFFLINYTYFRKRDIKYNFVFRHFFVVIFPAYGPRSLDVCLERKRREERASERAVSLIFMEIFLLPWLNNTLSVNAVSLLCFVLYHLPFKLLLIISYYSSEMTNPSNYRNLVGINCHC